MTAKINKGKAPEISGVFLNPEIEVSANEINPEVIPEEKIQMSGGLFVEFEGETYHRLNITNEIAKKILIENPDLKQFFK